MTTRRIIASARAIGVMYGPEAGESFAQGWPGWTKYAEPDWWESRPELRRRLDTSYPDWLFHPENYGIVTIPKFPNPTTRVSVEGGPVLWEEA